MVNGGSRSFDYFLIIYICYSLLSYYLVRLLLLYYYFVELKIRVSVTMGKQSARDNMFMFGPRSRRKCRNLKEYIK